MTSDERRENGWILGATILIVGAIFLALVLWPSTPSSPFRNCHKASEQAQNICIYRDALQENIHMLSHWEPTFKIQNQVTQIIYKIELSQL